MFFIICIKCSDFHLGQLRNLALKQKAFQSSINHGGLPSRAVDGVKNDDWYQKSCTHTSTEPNPWWYVDLGDVHNIQTISVLNRGDCCGKDSFATSCIHRYYLVLFLVQ